MGDRDDAGAHSGDPVAMARALVAVPSVNPTLEHGGTGEEAVSALAAGWLTGWGFEVSRTEVARGRWNVLATHGGADQPGPSLFLNGHIDTVGVEGMTLDPFGAEIVDGRLLGRGSCDMKGGCAALLAAAHRISRAGHPGQIVVGLVCDEEEASLGIQAMIEEMKEKGIAPDAAVVCEPTELSVMPAHKGFVWAEIDFRGRAAHGSRPEVGVDAVVAAGHYLVALERYGEGLKERSAHPLLGHGSTHAGTIRGGSAPSVYPERCTLTVERRTLPGEDTGAVGEELRDLLEGRSADYRVTLERPGTEVTADHPLVGGLLAAAGAYGGVAELRGMTAYVDAAFLNLAGIPAVCYGPGSIAKAHTADEYCPVDEIERCADVLEAFARWWLQGADLGSVGG